MILPLLRRLSLLHPRRASLAADVLQAARHAAADVCDRLGDACFAAEQALRHHDREHQRRQERAAAGLRAFIAAMSREEPHRWN